MENRDDTKNMRIPHIFRTLSNFEVFLKLPKETNFSYIKTIIYNKIPLSHGSDLPKFQVHIHNLILIFFHIQHQKPLK